jgi:hypothetical protein
VRSLDGQNFAYVEVKNPGDSAAAVSLTVDGPNPSALSLFAYASPAPPSSRDNVNQCMVSGEGRVASGTSSAVGPSLAVTDGTGLVVGAHASVFVMLATEDTTGAFTLKTRTVSLAAVADTPSITIPTSSGGEVASTVLVSGGQRIATPLPAPKVGTSSSCGKTGYTVQSFHGQNFAYVEVKNPGDSAAAVSLTVDGPNLPGLSLFAYASPAPPSSRDDVNQCMVSDEGHFAPGTSIPVGPSLSVADGKGVIVGPHASAFVMLATDDTTGVFTVKTRLP